MSFTPGMGFARLFYFSRLRVILVGMKSSVYLWLPAAILLGACSQKSDTPIATTNSSSTASGPVNASAGYLGALAKGKQLAVTTVDTTSLDKAIQMFTVENGRNPKDLNELVEQKFIARIPDAPYGTKLAYDPVAGTVKVVQQ